jgi:drug/metabolite transporter (DMT)-like permease
MAGAAIAPAMFSLGLKLTTAIDSSLLSNGEIIFSILLALTVFGEKLNRTRYIAMALVLTGIQTSLNTAINTDLHWLRS